LASLGGHQRCVRVNFTAVPSNLVMKGRAARVARCSGELHGCRIIANHEGLPGNLMGLAAGRPRPCRLAGDKRDVR
jgi:hypothetical protein